MSVVRQRWPGEKRSRTWKLFQSVQLSHSFVFDSVWPHGLQHTRLPCPSPTLGACSNSCPSGWWCHPIISSSVVPFFSHLQSFPASGPFPMNQLFTSGSQRTGASALVSVLPMNTQGQFTLGLTGLVSLLSKGLWRVFFSTTVQKHQLFSAELQDNYGRRLSPAQTTYFSESGATPAHTWA